MKKVILLAVAAVIYTASANAQTATPIGITIPDGYQATSFYISGNGEKAIAGFKKDESVKFLLYEKNGKTFSQGTAVPFLDELIAQKKNPTTPSLSHDGTRIYFSAKNENGDNDIFYSDKNNGQWDTPVNMGENINTAADEMYPSVSSDGLSIYFTRPKSDAKDSRCGVIYTSQRAPYGEWSEATALVEPLNLGCETAPYISRLCLTVRPNATLAPNLTEASFSRIPRSKLFCSRSSAFCSEFADATPNAMPSTICC